MHKIKEIELNMHNKSDIYKGSSASIGLGMTELNHCSEVELGHGDVSDNREIPQSLVVCVFSSSYIDSQIVYPQVVSVLNQ